MTDFMRFLFITLLMTLTACADLQTVERRTTLPFSDETAPHDGVAIHLDAQQRLVMFHLNKYCAEPSPDALAAYAASLGLGASTAGKNAESMSQGMQGAAGSIGLRTQSITLMRDALYRVCEAASNGNLNSIEVAKLLHQSQDLTAVILAVEQLTGAVAANQIYLTGTTSASATANLVSNQQALDAVRKSEADKKKDLDDATTAKQTADQLVADKSVALQTAKDKVEKTPTSDPSYDSLTKDRDQKQAELDQAQANQKNASNLYDLRKKIYDDAVTLRQQIETQKDSALASTTAATATSGQFSTPVPRVELNKDASEAIAISVKEMVQSVLNKEYSADVCMSYLTGGEARDPEVTGICKAVWVERSSAAKKRLDEYEKIRAYAPDDATRLLQKALDEDHPKNIRDDLKKWLEKNKLNIDITLFLNGAGYSLQRQLAVIQLKIGSQQADTPPKAEPPKKAESPKKAEPPKKAVGADASPKTGTPSTDTPKGK